MNDVVKILKDTLTDPTIDEVELVCCDKNGPCLRTKDKVVDVKGLMSVDDPERYHQIRVDFENFSWTFHHKIPKGSIKNVSENELVINCTSPFICGQFLIRIYRSDVNGTPS